MQNERLQRLTSEYSKLWKRRGSIAYKTFITPDDLQDAYCYILTNKMEQFGKKSNGQAYIYMVAKSKARKRLKRLAPIYVDTFELKEGSEEGIDKVIENEYRKTINSYLNKESFEDRQMLSRIMNSGGKWKEVSKETGVGLSTLRYRYAKKIQKLKELLYGNN